MPEAPRYRDPERDPDASLKDFVYRLRRLGYPGNVRVEFPIFTVEDTRWLAKILNDAAVELVALWKNQGVGPLARVLQARSIITHMDAELKRRTTHRRVKNREAGI